MFAFAFAQLCLWRRSRATTTTTTILLFFKVTYTCTGTRAPRNVPKTPTVHHQLSSIVCVFAVRCSLSFSLSRLLSLLISALSRKQNSPGARHKRVQTCYLSVCVCMCESEGVRAPVPVGFCLWGGRNTVMHYVCVCMRVSFQGQGNSIFCRCHSYDYYHYYYYYCCCC